MIIREYVRDDSGIFNNYLRPNEVIRDVQKRMNQWWFGTLEISNERLNTYIHEIS